MIGDFPRTSNMPSTASESETDRFRDSFNASPLPPSTPPAQDADNGDEAAQDKAEAAENHLARLANPASESDSGSASDRKKVLQAVAKVSKNDLIQIRKDTQGGYKGRDYTSCQ